MPSFSDQRLFKNTIDLPMVLNQQPIYDAYEHQLWDYLQKESGTFSTLWFATRPEAWSDVRVGFLRDEMDSRIKTYKTVIDSQTIWKQFQENHLKQIQMAAVMSESEAQKAALLHQASILSTSQSFADYAKKTGQYAQTQESFRISNKSDDKKQVDWTKTKIDSVLEERFNTMQALSYQLQRGEDISILKTRQKQRLKETENAFFKYYQEAPNDSDKNAFAKNVTSYHMHLRGEASAYNDLISIYQQTSEWEALKSYKARQMSEKRLRKEAEYQEAKDKVIFFHEQLQEETDDEKKVALIEEKNFWDRKAGKILPVIQELKGFESAWESGNLTYLAKKMSRQEVRYEGALRMEQRYPTSLQGVQEELLTLTKNVSSVEKEYILLMHMRQEYKKAVQNGYRQFVDPMDISLDESFNFQRYVDKNQDVLDRYMKRIDSTRSRELIKTSVQLGAAAVAQAGIRSAQVLTIGAAPATGGTSLIATAGLQACSLGASVAAYEMSESAGEEMGNLSSSLFNHWAEKDLNQCVQYLEAQKEKDLRQLGQIDVKKYQKALDFAIKRATSHDNKSQVLNRVKNGEWFFAASQAEGLTGFYLKPQNLEETALKQSDARMQKKLYDTFVVTTSVKTELDMRLKLIKQYEKALKMGLVDESAYTNQPQMAHEQFPKKVTELSQPQSPSLIQTLKSKENAGGKQTGSSETHPNSLLAPKKSESVLLSFETERQPKQEYSR